MNGHHLCRVDPSDRIGEGETKIEDYQHNHASPASGSGADRYADSEADHPESVKTAAILGTTGDAKSMRLPDCANGASKHHCIPPTITFYTENAEDREEYPYCLDY